MRNIKLLLEYEGTDFSGWQWQPDQPTVQGAVETALKSLFQEPLKVTGAGRTDAGVHALGQVANFHVASGLDLYSIRMGLNNYLPDAVVVREVEEVPEQFHARYDAVKRCYRYVIAKRRRAIGRQFAWYCCHKLDVHKMKAASGGLKGTHQFAAFCKANQEEKHYQCLVDLIDWHESEHEISFEIVANRFLHHMVRIIVGTMVDVGRGKLEVESIPSILASGDRGRAGFLAPARGLFLDRILY